MKKIVLESVCGVRSREALGGRGGRLIWRHISGNAVGFIQSSPARICASWRWGGWGVYLWGRGGLMASVKTRFSVTCFTKGEENEACRATTIVVTLTCSKKDKTFTPGSQLTLSDCTKQNAQQNAQQKQSDGYTRRKKEQKTTKQNV